MSLYFQVKLSTYYYLYTVIICIQFSVYDEAGSSGILSDIMGYCENVDIDREVCFRKKHFSIGFSKFYRYDK